MLTVVSSPAGGGTVKVSPLGTPNYEATASITLTAVASAGYVFETWSGSVDGIAGTSLSIVTFTMGDATVRTIAANFVPSDVHCSVTAILEPSGGGLARFQPDQPAGGYRVNESVSVFAAAHTGYVFVRWGGDLAGGENPRTILVSEDKSVTATFNPTVTIYCSPSEAGSVVLDPAQTINGYATGTQVGITARANKGYRFVGWEEDASGSDRSITTTVDAPRIITARFEQKSESRWWLWVAIGVVGLLGGLILVRVVYARVNRGMPGEPTEPDD